MKPILSLLPFFVSLLFSANTLASGPKKVATLDRTLWPYSLNTPGAYNLASQYEIKRFAQIINEHELTTESQIQQFTQIDKVNLPSVNKWLVKTKQQLLLNYNNATKKCTRCQKATNWSQLSQLEPQTRDEKLNQWNIASGEFYQRYLYEQVRLAALFPRITSEIDKLSDDELDGSEFNDGEFLLTFDDGPSPNGNTQALSQRLNKEGIHSFFFVLGERLAKTSQDIPKLYQNQCLASHGYQHKAHPKWDNWQQSIADTAKLITKTTQSPPWYRPPYGQRTPEQLQYLADNKSKLMLWNIDSQDWNRKISEQQVLDRVVTLMLLWRKGIILYHDIHTKALFSVEALSQLQKKTGYHWLDCRDMVLKSNIKIDQ